MDDIQSNGHYWDKSNKVYKYKIEYNKERLKTSKMQETIRRDKYKDVKYYKWNVTTDKTIRPETIIIPNTPISFIIENLIKIIIEIEF